MRRVANPRFWDEANATRMGRYLSRIESRFLRECLEGLKPRSPIFFAGCSSGRDMQWAKKMGYRHGVGLDYDAGFLSAAVEKGLGFPLVLADALDLPFRSRSFPCSVYLEIVDYAADKQQLIREMYRVLEPGGRAIIQVTNRASLKGLLYLFLGKIRGRKGMPYGYSKTWFRLEEMLREAGFILERKYGYNWNLLARASQSPLVVVFAFFEFLGLHRLTSWSPWVLALAVKPKVR